MCSQNSASLEVSYGHLAEMQSLLAIWLTDVPKEMLRIFDTVLERVVRDAFPHYIPQVRYSLIHIVIITVITIFTIIVVVVINIFIMIIITIIAIVIIIGIVTAIHLSALFTRLQIVSL